MPFGIYSITNVVTGDMYIGQTIQDFEKRWKSHISALNRGDHDNDYLQRSWNKYGEDAFKFKAIHYCDELDILNDLEKYYIKNMILIIMDLIWQKVEIIFKWDSRGNTKEKIRKFKEGN